MPVNTEFASKASRMGIRSSEKESCSTVVEKPQKDFNLFSNFLNLSHTCMSRCACWEWIDPLGVSTNLEVDSGDVIPKIRHSFTVSLTPQPKNAFSIQEVSI